MVTHFKKEAWNHKKIYGSIISSSQGRGPISIIVLVALVVRLLAILFVPENIGLDNPTYQFSASDFLENGMISNCCIMPLYPLMLAIFGGGEEAQLFIGMVAGVCSVVLIWALARCMFESETIGLVAAGMMAVFPMAIFYSVIGLTESLFVVFVLAAFLALYKNKLVLTSIFFTLSILARPTIDIFAPFVIFWHALVIRRAGFFLAFRDLIIYGVIYAILMSPWWYHNLNKYGHFVRLSYGFGIVLYAGNNSMNESGGAIAGVDYYKAESQGILANHGPKDKEYKDKAIEYIRQNPSRFLKMAWVKFVRFWRLLPYTSTVENNPAAIMATLALLPVILLAIATLITRHKMFRHFTSVLGFIAYLTLVHIITVGSVRYRYPLEPFLILLAAPSLVLVWGQVFGKKTSLVDKP